MLVTDLSFDQLVFLSLPAIPNLWALGHVMRHEFPTVKEKSRWMMACVFLPCIGGLAYLAAGRRRARQPVTASQQVDISPVAVQPENVHARKPVRKREKDEWSFGCPDGDTTLNCGQNQDCPNAGHTCPPNNEEEKRV